MQGALAKFSERLKRDRGFSVAMRIGLNTGMVVAGEVGSSEKSAFTVMGDTVNLASRIEHHCRPGEVWVSRPTALAVWGRFELLRQEPIAVKGKKLSQVFFQAVRELSGTVDGPLTGRSAELSRLKAALEEARAGKMRVVTVPGEAGAGKTRLPRELLKDAGCDTLRSAALPRDASLYGLFAPLASALGFELPAAGQPKGDFFLGVERALRARAQAAPLLLVLEDCHFADAGSWDLLAFLLGALSGLPLMIVCLYRPEAETSLPWSTVPGRQAIDLRPLGPLDRLTLIEALLGPNELPARLKSGLAESSGGNAFFLTELVRNLLESDADSALPTPASVQGAVLARVDRLPAEVKLALQVASVLGLEFSAYLLERAEPSLAPSGELLAQLVERHYLEPREEGHYAFAHAIMQDVCYGSILKERRAHYHRLVSRLWESCTDDDCRGHQLMRAADHAYWAREGARAVDLNWRAALVAEMNFSGDKSVLFLQRVMELSSWEAPPAKGLVLLKLGDVYNWVFEPDRSLACYLEALDLLQDEPAQVVELYRKIATVYNIRGEPRRAEEMFVKAAEALGGKPVTRHSLALYYEVATAFFRSGRDEDAKAWILRIMEQYKKEGRRLPVPEDADIYRLMPAFSDLVKPP